MMELNSTLPLLIHLKTPGSRPMPQTCSINLFFFSSGNGHKDTPRGMSARMFPNPVQLTMKNNCNLSPNVTCTLVSLEFVQICLSTQVNQIGTNKEPFKSQINISKTVCLSTIKVHHSISS